MKFKSIVPHCCLTALLTSAAGLLFAPSALAQAEAPVEPVAPEEAPAEPEAPAEAAPAQPAPEPVAPEPAPEPVPEPAAAAPIAPQAAPPEAVPPEAVPPEAVPPVPPALEEPVAAPALPLSLAGSFWTRYEVREGYADHGLSHPRLHREGDYLVSRARLAVATTPIDIDSGVKASATFVPQAAYTMGTTGAPATIGDDPGIVLYEGFASVGGDQVRVDAGRFALNYGDALVIGNLGWNESARSFNGARMHLTPGGSAYYIDVLGTIISEGRAVTQEAVLGDVYFWGVYAGLGPAIAEGLELDAYFLGTTTTTNRDVALTDPMDPTVTAVGERDSATDLTLGARLKGAASIVDYRLETGLQFGKSPVEPSFAAPTPSPRDKSAYHIDAEVGVAPVNSLRLSVEGAYASGDDLETTADNEGWNELYPTGHKFLGFADVVGGRTNIVTGVLHLQFAPIKPLKLSLDAHYFARPQAGPDGKDGAMGSEIDTNVLYAFGGGASVRGMYAVFLPNEDFWETKATSPDVAGDAIHYFELQFGLDFK